MGFGFLQKGKAAQKQIAKADAEAEARKKASATRRFYLPDGAEGKVLFLDGELTDEGVLDATTFWEHQLKMNGHWRNWYPCTQISEPCPICEGGDNPSLVAVFTVIDLNEWSDKQGVTHKNERRLFVVKRETLKRLQKIAAKRGGLKGLLIDVSRVGEKSASVGDTFDVVEKVDIEKWAKKNKVKAEEAVPFDYEEVFTYYTADELREMGFGDGTVPVGNADKVGKSKTSKAKDAKADKGKKKPKPADEDEEEEEEEEEEEAEEEEEEVEDDDV